MAREPVELEGASIAGIETAIEVPSLKLVLDMGRCSRTAVNYANVVVSHGHLDHAGALPLHAARRALLNLSEPRYFVPKSIAAGIERLFNAAGELDGKPIARRVVALEPGEEQRLSSRLSLRPFATFHRVPSQGYTVWERRHHLRPEFRGKPGPELALLRARGVAIDEPHEVALLAFTGDTRVEVLERHEELHTVETLIIEASFLDQRVTADEARAMGHIHLDELVARRELLRSPDVVLSHFSARYTPPEVRGFVAALPEELRGRVRALLA